MRHCVCCRREVHETVHRGDGYRVDCYCLHTGKTKRMNTQDEHHRGVELLQLFDPEDIYLCLDCMAKPENRDVWLQTFPDSEHAVKVFHG